jgi:hypothetical protein
MRRAYIDLQFAPHWELIDPAREFLLSFFSVALDDTTLGEQVCLAAHELMENAIKYSPNDEAKIRVEVDGNGPITIAVENQALAEHIPQLLAEVRAIREADDPLAFYRRKMEESSSRSDGKSCLGLARIRCEAGMLLECRVDESGLVRMIAVRHPAGSPLD